ncbi:hypothetical protein GCM10010389_33570 [Streptomyces echinoruber]|uniref:Uncharacterized protein n=1 Tax=Streptomyces echinoruber TaxID=68898 RepID=A0A918RCC1_9ACTN|nr:hypothetical protein GCM10010389_33570 [Streptomyces echinoruber]
MEDPAGGLHAAFARGEGLPADQARIEPTGRPQQREGVEGQGDRLPWEAELLAAGWTAAPDSEPGTQEPPGRETGSARSLPESGATGGVCAGVPLTQVIMLVARFTPQLSL